MPTRPSITKMPPWVDKATRTLGATGHRFEDVYIRRKAMAGLCSCADARGKFLVKRKLFTHYMNHISYEIRFNALPFVP